MGTKKLYDFADHNPDVLLYPVDYTNNPVVVAQNKTLSASTPVCRST